MKIVTVVGARPQFIKAAAVSRVVRSEFAGKIEEVLVHTGQHYDDNMSKVFFEELDIPEPRFNLEISGGHHGAMTGRMLEAIEKVLLQEKPDWLLIYGDTNSTLAGALAAAKLHIPVAHVEAGLRSFNMNMPEEINRILADRVSSLLFCPTKAAVANLRAEGLSSGLHNVGDVMYDAALHYGQQSQNKSSILNTLGLTHGGYVLATCHRAENTDNLIRLRAILSALAEISNLTDLVIPLHPRTRNTISKFDLMHYMNNIKVVDPLPFLDMIALEQAASLILTDSGGVQKEAYFYKVPCVTMRDETEWHETLEGGWNRLVGADEEKIINAYRSCDVPKKHDNSIYGDGRTGQKILNLMLDKAAK